MKFTDLNRVPTALPLLVTSAVVAAAPLASAVAPPVDAQTVDAQTVDAQTVDAQTVDAQTVDAQTVDAPATPVEYHLEDLGETPCDKLIAVNSSGEVLILYVIRDGPARWRVVRRGRPPTGWLDGNPLAIDDAGRVVGSVGPYVGLSGDLLGDLNSRAFLWEKGAFRYAPPYSKAVGFAPEGRIYVSSRPPLGESTRPLSVVSYRKEVAKEPSRLYLWDGAGELTLADPSTPPPPKPREPRPNRYGDTVSGVTLTREGRKINLLPMIRNRAGWSAMRVEVVNDRLMIAGKARYKGETHCILLVPVKPSRSKVK